MNLYSVLLVDDEAEVFQVIMKKLDWERMGFHIAGYASNGVEALEIAEELNQARQALWDRYYERLEHLGEQGRLELPRVPEDCIHNAHMFYVKAGDIEERTRLIDWLKENGILSVFHYIPLHTAPAGKAFGRFHGEDRYTTRESERLLRLPMYYGLTVEQVDEICDAVKKFYRS